jgi:16S rRNA (cytosine967-C5)-methyltransferase
MYSGSYLKTAIQILERYKSDEPFSSFLKKYFAQHKKHGSNDRKQISHLCYCYFRTGKLSLQDISPAERILVGLFLCSDKPNAILEELKPEWNRQIELPVKEKLSKLDRSLLIGEVFPWKEELSSGIDHEKFCNSFFIQPNLFLRLRPNHEIAVMQKLINAEINFSKIDRSCLSLSNNSKIENVIELDVEAVVQDLNSQRTIELTRPEIIHYESKIAAWDCCAASGGKSLLLYDINSNIDLTVSDIRESILVNLKKRFSRAGIKKYKTVIADLTKPFSTQQLFDVIICDAPCTGSGTWSRTPEQLYFFEEKKIEQYASLQKRIVSNIIPHLNQNGCLLYITCSVFKKENEEVVNFITMEFDLKLIKAEILTGYDKKADTMFAALFKKS